MLHNGEENSTKLSDGRREIRFGKDFSRYLQLRQYFLKEIGKNSAIVESNEIIQLTVQAYSGSSKSVVSKLYQGKRDGRGN